VCSEIPGEFVWKPGPLFEAANNGHWLLLEDIDYATVDSISLLIDMLETNFIKTNETYIRVHANFRMFLTQRTQIKKLNNLNYLDSMNKLSRLIQFEDLSDVDITQVRKTNQLPNNLSYLSIPQK
jgi:midasin